MKNQIMKKQVSVYLDTTLIKEIKYRSLSLDLSVSEYLTKLVKGDLKDGENKS
jgi:hypothetical protein